MVPVEVVLATGVAALVWQVSMYTPAQLSARHQRHLVKLRCAAFSYHHAAAVHLFSHSSLFFLLTLRCLQCAGPTFLAENSNTARHLAEFWMIEPEMAFADLTDDMACAEVSAVSCRTQPGCRHLAG